LAELILLIDDDESLRRVTEYNLTAAGFQVIPAASGREGLAAFRDKTPDLVVTDVKLGDLSGLEILETVKREAPEIPVIVITAFGSIEMAVNAMRQGAFNFITKPFDRDTLRLSCRKALELKTLQSRNRLLSEELDKLRTLEMETANPVMRELLQTALRVAASEATVLITGESGTGKEVLARLIHRHSPRRERAMVTVNCAAIPPTLIESELFGHVKGAFTGAVASRKGRFQTASSGTIFLDEIGELALEMQAKLLRVLQEQELEPVGSDRREKVDVRIIAATNKDLQEAIRKGEFREDLFYRLGVIPLHMPPLRERPEDIPLLANHFLKKFNAPPEVRFSEGAMGRMRRYAWPGNIRELQNLVERCVILRKDSLLREEDLYFSRPAAAETCLVPEIPPEGLSLEEVEKGLIQKALSISGGNRSEAARLLRIPRHVLIYRLEKFGL
jgi:DNA-binding NtrC family response regulator